MPRLSRASLLFLAALIAPAATAQSLSLIHI